MWADAVSGWEDILLAFGTPESVQRQRIWGRPGQRRDRGGGVLEGDHGPVPWTGSRRVRHPHPGGLDDENVVAHDYSTVEALQRQKKERGDRALNEVKAGP